MLGYFMPCTECCCGNMNRAVACLLVASISHGAEPLAITSCCGPVQTALGITSPKISTNVTEMMMAANSGTSLSKNRGRASAAAAFANRRVTSVKWWFSVNQMRLCGKEGMQ